MSHQQFAALLGFAFVAVWVGPGFDAALFCLLGAAVFWAIDGLRRGELDLEEINQRIQGEDRPR